MKDAQHIQRIPELKRLKQELIRAYANAYTMIDRGEHSAHRDDNSTVHDRLRTMVGGNRRWLNSISDYRIVAVPNDHVFTELSRDVAKTGDVNPSNADQPPDMFAGLREQLEELLSLVELASNQKEGETIMLMLADGSETEINFFVRERITYTVDTVAGLREVIVDGAMPG